MMKLLCISWKKHNHDHVRTYAFAWWSCSLRDQLYTSWDCQKIRVWIAECTKDEYNCTSSYSTMTCFACFNKSVISLIIKIFCCNWMSLVFFSRICLFLQCFVLLYGQLINFLDWKCVNSYVKAVEFRIDKWELWRVHFLCWIGNFFTFGDFSNWTCTSFKYKCVTTILNDFQNFFSTFHLVLFKDC